MGRPSMFRQKGNGMGIGLVLLLRRHDGRPTRVFLRIPPGVSTFVWCVVLWTWF